MIITSSYYDKFSCVGGECQNTCCVGWGVLVDADTYAFYQSVSGEFGDYLRENLESDEDGKAMIRMGEGIRCPFLDEEGLCQIYQNCGSEHMGDTCAIFPRVGDEFDSIELLGLSLSCEEVLRLICEEPEPLVLCCRYEPGEKHLTNEELPATVLFTMWAVKYIQDPATPLNIGMGTLLYIGMNASNHFLEKDSRRLSLILENVSDVMESFRQIRTTFDRKELYQTAENVVFQVVDTFCQVVKVSNLPNSHMVLWSAAVFDYTDEERRLLVRRGMEKLRENPIHLQYMRRLVAGYLLARSQELKQEGDERHLLLEKFANYIVLATILPLIWSETIVQDLEYFSRLGRLGRMFEHSPIICNYVYPVLRDVFHLDEMSYVLAFLVLFEE